MSVLTIPRTEAQPEERRVSRDEALQRYPQLVAHMICESLGYFCPLSAANALAHHINGLPYACEWYSHMCSCRGKGYFHDATLLQIGADVVERAFKYRSHHKGYMAEFQRAIALVRAERERSGCTGGMLASWF
jgi:hypothetical protein